jgi:hypothetical protein
LRFAATIAGNDVALQLLVGPGRRRELPAHERAPLVDIVVDEAGSDVQPWERG